MAKAGGGSRPLRFASLRTGDRLFNKSLAHLTPRQRGGGLLIITLLSAADEIGD